MEKLIIVWLAGYVIAVALIFVSSRKWSDDLLERLLGAFLLGCLSWFYVAIAVAVHLLKRGVDGDGKEEGGGR